MNPAAQVVAPERWSPSDPLSGAIHVKMLHRFSDVGWNLHFHRHIQNAFRIKNREST